LILITGDYMNFLQFLDPDTLSEAAGSSNTGEEEPKQGQSSDKIFPRSRKE